MQKITPFLTFGQQAEEAFHCYLPVFKNAPAEHAMKAMMQRVKLDSQQLQQAYGAA